MSGSRLGRGRAGRLAVYGACGVMVLLLVYLYRAATSEMARLHELHEQCAHQQEALAAQLQVIFEYKVRLEKSLAEEKSSNAAVKQELQQRATREKSLRDKDSVEAMQRFNSLQQTYKLLQTEHQDLQEECKKREKQTLDETSRLETTLQDLRGRIRQSQDSKKALESLKTKYLVLETDKTNLEDKYNELMINNGNSDSTINHLKKELFQLRRELESSKKFHRSIASPIPILMSSRVSVSQPTLRKEDSLPIPAPQQQQPQRNGNIVPAGPSELRETTGKQPLGSDFQQKQPGDVVERPNAKAVSEEQNALFNEEQRKQVMSPPALNRDDDSRNEMVIAASQAEQPLEKTSAEKASKPVASKPIKIHVEDVDELQALQERVNGIFDHDSAIRDSINSRKAESTTAANHASLVSPSQADRLALIKPLSKVKLPAGVLPIPQIIEQKIEDDVDENKRQEDVRKRDDVAARNNLPAPPAKFALVKPGSKEEKEDAVEAGNLDPPFVANLPAAGHHGGQVADRRANEAWFRVGPGVQEVGEEINQLDRVPGLDDGQANGGDDQYDGGDYDKEPQQKNDIHLAEGEDEGEDEGDMLEYPHNLKQEKRE